MISNELSASEIYKRWSKAIVTIRTNDGTGTGFFDQKGNLITACHVIIDSTSMYGRFNSGKTISIEGIKQLDISRDLAILDTAYNAMKGPLLGDFAALSPGDKVIVIGSPKGLELTVTEGIISAKRNIGNVQNIQISASISPGSSGSPVFNTKGEVIGVVSWNIEGGQQLNFAISSLEVKSLIKSLAEKPNTKLSLRPSSNPSSEASASRAGRPQEPQAAPTTMTVRPGKVVFDSVAIRTARATTSATLSTATRGQTLAILSEIDDLYGVLMVNNTIGWVDKNAVQLLDYNTEVTLETPKEQPPAASSELVEGSGLSEKQRQILREALSYMGVPYRWGGNDRKGIDDSAYVKNVFATIGVSLRRHSGDQTNVGKKITDTGELVAGERLYFAMKGGSTITHAGIYIGYGFFIHASSNHKCVDVDPLFKSYVNKLVAIRRDL